MYSNVLLFSQPVCQSERIIQCLYDNGSQMNRNFHYNSCVNYVTDIVEYSNDV